MDMRKISKICAQNKSMTPQIGRLIMNNKQKVAEKQYKMSSNQHSFNNDQMQEQRQNRHDEQNSQSQFQNNEKSAFASNQIDINYRQEGYQQPQPYQLEQDKLNHPIDDLQCHQNQQNEEPNEIKDCDSFQQNENNLMSPQEQLAHSSLVFNQNHHSSTSNPPYHIENQQKKQSRTQQAQIRRRQDYNSEESNLTNSVEEGRGRIITTVVPQHEQMPIKFEDQLNNNDGRGVYKNRRRVQHEQTSALVAGQQAQQHTQVSIANDSLASETTTSPNQRNRQLGGSCSPLMAHRQYTSKNTTNEKEDNDNMQIMQSHQVSLSDRVETASSAARIHPQISQQQNHQQTSLVRQFSDKIKTQAERLQKLEAYKKVCERRIRDFDPNHDFPVLESTIGQPASDGSKNKTSVPDQEKIDLKRQLARKEQDLSYARQRAEKVLQENDILRKELDGAKNNEHLKEKLAGSLSQKGGSGLAENQQDQANLEEKVRQLEQEKNDLLDYIEESVNMTSAPLRQSSRPDQESIQHTISPSVANLAQSSTHHDVHEDQNQQQHHRMTLNDMSQRIEALERENRNFRGLVEDARRTEASSRQRISDLQEQVASTNKEMAQFTSQRGEETFGNMPTGLTKNSPQITSPCHGVQEFQGAAEGTLGAQGHQTQQSSEVDYMVLDLQQIRAELAETQKEFNSTREVLKVEQDEKAQLEMQLKITSARLQDLEKNNKTAGMHEKKHGQETNESEREAGERSVEAELRQVSAQLEQSLNQRDTLLDEVKVLKATLDETQQQLEDLIGDHEQLSNQFSNQTTLLREAQQIPAKLKEEGQEIRLQLNDRNERIQELQQQMRQMSSQSESQNVTLQNLRAENMKQKQEIARVEETSKNQQSAVEKTLEARNDDMARELKMVKSELNDRESAFYALEKQMKGKLVEIDEVQGQRHNLTRRVEDLSHQLRTLQAQAERKDSKLKEQVRQNEEMAFELERAAMNVQRASQERNSTRDARKTDTKILEAAQNRNDKQARVINKLCRDVAKVADLVTSLGKEFNQPIQQQPAAAESNDESSKSNTLNSARQKQTTPVDEQLKEANSFLKMVGQWLVQFARNHKSTSKQLMMAQEEILMANRKVEEFDGRIRAVIQEEYETKESKKFLETEVSSLKDKLAETHQMQREGYDREERTQKTNQVLKARLDAAEIQKEKLQLQIKTLLAEKEALVDQIEDKDCDSSEQIENLKSLELQISQLVEQKESMLDLMVRLQDAFPSQSLREVFSSVVSNVKEGFQLDQSYQQVDKELLEKERELRLYAKREVEGLLSTKVINIRKTVEQGRDSLRELQQKADDNKDQLNQLETDLKNTEMIERRRGEVALETERALAQCRSDLQATKKELIFVNRNRQDIEIALKAQQQEREMVERELLALRNQLQAKATTFRGTIQNDLQRNTSREYLRNRYDINDAHQQLNGEPLYSQNRRQNRQPVVDSFPTNNASSHPIRECLSEDRRRFSQYNPPPAAVFANSKNANGSDVRKDLLRNGDHTANFPSLIQDSLATGSIAPANRPDSIQRHAQQPARRYPSEDPALNRHFYNNENVSLNPQNGQLNLPSNQQHFIRQGYANQDINVASKTPTYSHDFQQVLNSELPERASYLPLQQRQKKDDSFEKVARQNGGKLSSLADRFGGGSQSAAQTTTVGNQLSGGGDGADSHEELLVEESQKQQAQIGAAGAFTLPLPLAQSLPQSHSQSARPHQTTSSSVSHQQNGHQTTHFQAYNSNQSAQKRSSQQHQVTAVYPPNNTTNSSSNLPPSGAYRYQRQSACKKDPQTGSDHASQNVQSAVMRGAEHNGIIPYDYRGQHRDQLSGALHSYSNRHQSSSLNQFSTSQEQEPQQPPHSKTQNPTNTNQNYSGSNLYHNHHQTSNSVSLGSGTAQTALYQQNVQNGGGPLQPIMSQYGGEITSRTYSGQTSPARGASTEFIYVGQAQTHQQISRDSSNNMVFGKRDGLQNEPPLLKRRNSSHAASLKYHHNRQQQVVEDDVGVNDEIDTRGQLLNNNNAALQGGTESEQCENEKGRGDGTVADYDQHRESVTQSRCSMNESSVHKKLSQLKNVFSAIRQNLQDESGQTAGGKQTTTGMHSSLEQSMVQP